jgi:hypothetical protein
MLNYTLAGAEDDASLRARMAADWLEGDITVSFRREPSFFYGSGVQGAQAQVIKCVDSDSNQLIGLGSRVLNDAYVNGSRQRVGYLADLRAHPDYRGGTFLGRGYQYFRQLHHDDPVPLYYSMILEENKTALQLLTRARCGLPLYRDIGRFLTPVIHLDLPRRAIPLAGIHYRRAALADLPAIFDFMSRQASQKQFAPVISAQDMHGARLRGLKAEDFYLALRKEQIVGTIAAWDQTGFRQTCVERYSPGLRMLRPFYNALSRFTALKPLPAPGCTLPYFYLAFVNIEGNNAQLFRGLLRHLYRDRRSGPWSYFVAGLHETDPLSSVLSEYRSIDAAGRLFAVHYAQDQRAYEQLDGRIPHVEIAMI